MTGQTQSKDVLIKDEMSELIIETADRLGAAHGVHTVTVRKLLRELGITNRVFYNRFHNINEVLDAVYERMSLKVRDSSISRYDGQRDFFEYVMDVIERSLLSSYDTKMRFNQFVFENDSLTNANYEWWMAEIKKLIDYAKARDLIRDVDSDVLGYSIWCFCRGYNADAVGRGLPRDEAVKKFRYSFGFLLDGLKK